MSLPAGIMKRQRVPETGAAQVILRGNAVRGIL